VLAKIATRWQTIFLCYALLALLAFPILEISILGANAPQFAHDAFDQIVARLGSVAADWHQYGLTLWNPYLTAGDPLLSQFVMSPFSVDVLLSLFVSPFTAYSLTYYLIILVAGYSMHMFLRSSMGLSNIASLVGGIVYMFIFWPYDYGFTGPLIPLMFLLFDKAASSLQNRRKYLIGCIILVVFLLYGSHTQLALLMAGLHLVYVIFSTSPQSRLLTRLGEWFCVWALGILIYAPVLVTQLVFVSISNRTIWDLTFANEDTTTPLKSVIAQYSSVIFGMPIYRSLGRSPGIFGTYYVGMIGLSALIISVVAPNKSRRNWFFLISLIGIPLFDLLSLAVLPQAQESLSFLKSFNFSRVRHFIQFILAVNVAVGISCLQTISWRELTAGLIRKSLWILLALFIALQTAANIRTFFIVMRPFEKVSVASDLRSSLLLLGWTLGLIYTIINVIVWIFILFKGRSILLNTQIDMRSVKITARKTLLYTLLILIVADRMIYARVERFIDNDTIGTFTEWLGTTPALSFLKNQSNSQKFRTLTFSNPDELRTDHPNKMMFHRLYAADGYEMIYPLRYHEIFGLLTAPYLAKDPGMYAYFHGWGNRAYVFGPDVNMALASLMGIRWFYARDMDLDSPSLVKVFEAGGEKIYENIAVFPRAFVVHNIRAFSTRTELLTAFSSATTEELRTQAYILENDVSNLNLHGLSNASGGTGEVAMITRYEPDQVTVEVDTNSPAVLVFTDVNAPGWVCTVNGDDTRIFYVDNAFRGVVVPAGHSQIIFRYVPWYTYAGAGLAVLGIIATGLWYLILGHRTTV
jgi:hypothetical protein